MDQQIERPRVLSVLLILSFIGSGMTLFSNAMIYAFFDEFQAVFSAQPDLTFLGSTMDLSSILNVNSNYFLLQAVFSAMALYGAILMWKYKKKGLHIYAIAQIIILIIPKLFIAGLPFPAFELSISALFVYMYYKHLHLMS